MLMAAVLAGCRRSWLAMAGPLLSFLVQMGTEKAPVLFCRGSISGTLGSFQSGAFVGQRDLTIANEGCGQGREPQENCDLIKTSRECKTQTIKNNKQLL